MSTDAHDYRVRVHEEDGSYWATVDSLPGCFAAGHTLAELRDDLAGAISAYLSTNDHHVDVQILADDKILVSESVTFIPA